MMKRLRRAMATRFASNSASACELSTCLVQDTFCCWSSPKPLPAPLPSLSALALDIQGHTIPKRGRFDDRYHPAPLRDLSLFGESSGWSWSQGPGLEISGDSSDYAKTRPDGADRRLP